MIHKPFSLLIGGKKPELKFVRTNNRPTKGLFPHRMEKDFEKKDEAKSVRRRWDEGDSKYKCADGTDVWVLSKIFEPDDYNSKFERIEYSVHPRNGILYRPRNGNE